MTCVQGDYWRIRCSHANGVGRIISDPCSKLRSNPSVVTSLMNRVPQQLSILICSSFRKLGSAEKPYTFNVFHVVLQLNSKTRKIPDYLPILYHDPWPFESHSASLLLPGAPRLRTLWRKFRNGTKSIRCRSAKTVRSLVAFSRTTRTLRWHVGSPFFLLTNHNFGSQSNMSSDHKWLGVFSNIAGLAVGSTSPWWSVWEHKIKLLQLLPVFSNSDARVQVPAPDTCSDRSSPRNRPGIWDR